MDTGAPWHQVWMSIAKQISRRSKDPNTKVGAVIVSPDNRRLFVGYNGFVRGVLENIQRWKRPEKYRRVLHAEENALLQRNCDVECWTCFVTLRPCAHCSQQLAQSGIKKIVYLEERVDEDYELTEETCREVGIELIQYQGDLHDRNKGPV